MTPSNVYRASRLKLLIASGGAVIAGLSFWLFSSLSIDHVYGTVALVLGAGGLLVHFLRPALVLRIDPDSLRVNGRAVPWDQVDVSELKERRKGALHFPAFVLMVADPASDTGRRTFEFDQPDWRRFDELYDALKGMADRRAGRAR